MSSSNLISKAQTYFPKLQIAYKDTSKLMKVLGILLFFNKSFMTDYTTTIGNTIYLPNANYPIDHPQEFADVFIHECVHLYDQKRINNLVYQAAYLFPQILAPFICLLMFIVSWKIILPIVILSLAPIPAPWRTYFEKRAYFVQMYVANQLYNDNILTDGYTYLSWFVNSNYYWMDPFEKDASFEQEAANISNGNPSCKGEPALYQMILDLITAAKV